MRLRRRAQTGPWTLIVGHGGRESALASADGRAQRAARVRRAREPVDRARTPPRSGGGHAGRRRLRPARRGGVRARARDRHRDGQRRRTAAGGRRRRAARPGHARGRARRSAGAEIEWNKTFARSLLAERRAGGRAAAARRRGEPARSTRRSPSFGSTPVAVKPSGLTGGKGVKVMGPHLAEPRRGARTTRSSCSRAAAPASRC